MALRCLAARPDPDSHLLASRASLLRGDREEARRLIEKGLRLAPGDARLEKALATLDEK
jgi:Flp pilus assembly protein TadD